MHINKNLKRMMIFLLLFAFFISFALPMRAEAEEKEPKVVRVGWYESSFCYYDSFGRRCGIDYEYQQKISAYTGWTYEYVEGSWPELLQKLMDGEIDILSDVSYKQEREEFMLYPDLPMGTESYYIYISQDNHEITGDDPTSLSGKRIGVNKGSIQEGFLEDWAKKNGVTFEIVLLVVDEDESMALVERGEVDGYATVYTISAENRTVPIYRIGGSDYFYAVNKNRPDLLAELNIALAGIQDEDPYFAERISEERLYEKRTNIALQPNQEEWLKKHGKIRIGYRDNYLPFCQADEETGELTGALKDYLTHATNELSSVVLQFETIPYASTEAALAAMKAGEVDAVFPVYLHSYDADKMDVRLTDPAMKTEMNAVMRTSETRGLSKESVVTFAVDAGNLNNDTFIMEEYPASTRKVYADKQACFKAVSDGEVDCALVSSYRLSYSEEIFKDYKVYSVPTGESISMSFAVGKDNPELYFLLNKTAIMTESEEMDAALVSYMKAEQKVSFLQFLKDNMLMVILVLVLVFAVIVILLQQKMRAERVAGRQRKLLEEAAEIAELKQTITSLLDNMPGMTFTKDAESGVYLACNQAFADYAKKKDPSEVVGHTPEELFDAETAKRFIEDDKTALSMEEPLIYFENMTDADGNVRQIKTTKQKYTDDNGRLCVLGVFLDVTDSFRISRDKAGSKETYEKAKNSGIIFTHIAQTLAQGYMDLYYIDIDSEEFVEFRTDPKDGSLTEARRGWHFFEECEDVADEYVFSEDREAVKAAMDRKTLVAALDQTGSFSMIFRMKREPEPVYVSMTISRMQDDERYLILGVTDVDEEVKQRNAAQKMQEEQAAYNRITALAGDFFCIYIVDPETGEYREFSSTAGFESFDRPAEGTDFFDDSREQALRTLYPEDRERFLSMLTKKNVLTEVKQNGIFTLSYRLMMEGEPRYVQLKAAMVEEKEGPRLIVGVNDIDAQVRQEEEYSRRLAQARIEANIDALTGVKNRNAYRVYEERLNAQIEIGRAPDFAITILDVNDLKKVNDTEGHKAGDQYLRDACKIICTTFKRSPVFRVGGDEFCVLSQGDDLARIDELIEQMNEHNDDAIRNGGIVIALGMARYEHDDKVAPVYERADQIMYDNKSDLKARKRG